MTVGPSQINSGRTLASVLDEHGKFEVAQALALVRHLARQINELHATGMVHGAITLQAIRLDDFGVPRLEAPGAAATLQIESEWAGLDPAFSRLPTVPLPVGIDVLRRHLAAEGTSVDPRQLDLFGWGAVWCRLLTGESVSAYLRSPRVKGLVPGKLRPALERMLSANGREPFDGADQVLAELDALADRIPQLQPVAPGEAQAPAADNDLADPSASKTGDTTPSFMSSGDLIADTTVVAPADIAAVGSSPAESGARDRDSDVLPFARLGHYEILGRLGQGGMGEVYLGYERALDRKVAVKVLPADLARNGEFVRRFKAEASAAARLIHPHVVQIFLIGEDAGHHYFAMQYVAGESLAGLLHRRKKLAVDETLSLIEQVLSGLGAAHKMGLVHRDIKPGNILLDREQNRALLGDFGLVKLLEASATGHTATGVVMGTVDYISPEQGRGLPVDGRSDLYSMGVLIYQLLSGRLPFEADNPTALIFQHVYEPPPPLAKTAPDIPASLAAVVEKLLAKSPADRYRDVDELQDDLHAVRAGAALPSGADRPKTAPRPSAQSRERPSLVIQAPRLEDEVELPPAVHADLQPLGFWQAAQGRALSIFRRHAPEVIQQLQNTQQQLDGAVAEYARRERNLAKLVREAEEVYGELVSQAAAQRTASREAQARGRDASLTAAVHAAQVDELACAQAASELERQAAEQEDQLGQMRLRLAQASTRLQELRNQRDILHARFKAAGAQKLIAGNVRARNPLFTARVMIAGLLVLFVAVAVYFFRSPPSRTDDESMAASTGGSASGAAELAGELKAKRTTAGSRAVPPGMTALPLRQFSLNSDVRSAAFDRKSEQFITLADDGSLDVFRVPLWNANMPRKVLAGFDRKWTLTASAFSSDGELLAGATNAGSPVIHIWRIASDRQIREIAVNFQAIRNLAFSPDSAMLAGIATDARGRGTVAFWNVWPGDAPETAQIQEIDARSVVYAPGGDFLAIAGADRRVYLWNVQSAKIVHKFDQLAHPISKIAFCPGRSLVLAGDESGAITMWDSSSGQQLGHFEDKRKLQGGDQSISALAVSPDGRWLANADAERIYVWDVRLGSLRKVFEQPDTSILLFKSDGSLLVSSGPRGPIMVWSADFEATPTVVLMGAGTGSLITAEMPQITSRIVPLDDNSVLFGGGQQLHKYDRNLHTIVQRLSGHQGKVRAVSVSLKQGLYFSGSDDGTVRVWNAMNGEPVETLEARVDRGQSLEPVLSLAATASGTRVLVGTDRSVFVWQRLPESKLERIETSPGSAMAVAWSPDESRALASGFDGADGQGLVRILDVAARRELHCLRERTGVVSDALFTGSGSQFLYVDSLAAHLCGTDDAHEVRSISTAETKSAFQIGQSADKKYLSLGLGAALSIRDAQSGRELLRFADEFEKNPVLQSEFTPSGRFVVCLRAGGRLSWNDVFPARAMTRDFMGPVASNGKWYELWSDDRERTWQQLELDRPTAVHFEGPADVPMLADFHTDGGWSIVGGLLEREPGATRAAIDLGQIAEADVAVKVNLERTGVFFILLGWNGQRGHLLCKAPHDAGDDWRLYSAQTGDFPVRSRVSLGHPGTRNMSTLKLELRRSQFRLEFEGQRDSEWRPLPGYEPGHIVLGVVDGRNGDAPIKIESIAVQNTH